VIDISNLYHPPQDVGDNLDLIAAFPMPASSFPYLPTHPAAGGFTSEPSRLVRSGLSARHCRRSIDRFQ